MNNNQKSDQKNSNNVDLSKNNKQYKAVQDHRSEQIKKNKK